jgi:hypothetical protein
MLYAIASTGGLSLGTRRPSGCSSDLEHYIHILEKALAELSSIAELPVALKAAYAMIDLELAHLVGR